MGITNFEHIKKITNGVRNLLRIKKSEFCRSIALPPREPLALFLEQKRLIGKNSDSLTYDDFLRRHELSHEES
ncbi:sterile alpha motif domain-containing protein 15 [Tachypleus tridentatus]|uniref:sterile alpha motif domain-containing protein 15 n=1 Tax=Tachypleus tridentatus TaxID=6853 RepID=UPI003FD15874